VVRVRLPGGSPVRAILLVMELSHPEGAEATRAPSQADWDAMTPEQRRHVVDALSPSLGETEAAPPEGDLHLASKIGALDALRGFFGRSGRGVYVAAELTVYYPAARRFAPDLLVVFDVDPHPRTKWVVSAEGKGLDFVLEVHFGGDRKKDAETNVRRYAELGIPEYFVFDGARARLYGYRLPAAEAGAYVPVLPQGGRHPSQVLGLDLGVEGGRLRFYAANAPILETSEWVTRLAGMLDDVQRRAEDEARRAEDEAQRAEDEARRAAEEAQRAAEQAERAEAAERRAEQEARRAEEEARRAEEEARRAEQEARLRAAAEARVAELMAEIERLKR
jgi:Uma2 family endonuclease